MAIFLTFLALLNLSAVVEAQVGNCQRALTQSIGFNPIQRPRVGVGGGNVWTVDPFIPPPRGRCSHLPLDLSSSSSSANRSSNASAYDGFLAMDFKDYQDIEASCDDVITFVMRTVSQQQGFGVYRTVFNDGALAKAGFETLSADSKLPCHTPVKGGVSSSGRKLPMCEVRLTEGEKSKDTKCGQALRTEGDKYKDTECEGYEELYPMLMFGPNKSMPVVEGGMGGATYIQYTTPVLRSFVQGNADADTLVFASPSVQTANGETTSHCLQGMFVRVRVTNCMVSSRCTIHIDP
jgi:hypothetical protein